MDKDWLDALNKLKNLHLEFVRHLGVDDRAEITPAVLGSILEWVMSSDCNADNSHRLLSNRIAPTSRRFDLAWITRYQLLHLRTISPD